MTHMQKPIVLKTCTAIHTIIGDLWIDTSQTCTAIQTIIVDLIDCHCSPNWEFLIYKIHGESSKRSSNPIPFSLVMY